MLVLPGKQLLHAMATVSKELLFIMSHPCLGISDKPSLQIQQGEARKEGKSLYGVARGILVTFGIISFFFSPWNFAFSSVFFLMSSGSLDGVSPGPFRMDLW